MNKIILKVAVIAISAFAFSFGAMAEEVKYYKDLSTAVAETPDKETKQLGNQLNKDLKQYPIAWEQQIKNAVSNAGNSDTKFQSDDNQFWIPFDKIPGEDAFPMQKRLNLSARRGYQRSVIKGMVQAERDIAANSKVFKDIAKRHKTESENALADLLSSLKSSKSSSKNSAKNSQKQDDDQAKRFYEKECKFYFPNAGGCDTLAHSIVKNSLISQYTVHLASSPKGGELINGDVFISYADGRLVARDDQGGWVSWYKYDGQSSEQPTLTRAK